MTWSSTSPSAAFGRSDGYPYADILYLIAYPCFAAGLYGVSSAQFRRDAAIDGAIVAASVSAVIWHWVVTPVIDSSSGAPIERVVTVLYPVMDIVLMIAIVHAVFTLTRWRPSVWLLLCGLAIMLVGDTVYVQLVADGTPNSVAGIDALWPIAYVLLAGAALHPSMRDLWQGADVGPAQYSRGPHGHARRGAVRGARGRDHRQRRQHAGGRARARSPVSPPSSSRGASPVSSPTPTARARSSARARPASARWCSTPPTSCR